MNSIVVLLLFAGMALVMHGVYEEKLQHALSASRVEYRFLPRTLYEEQMAQTDLVGKMGNMFEKESPWYDRVVGDLSDLPPRRALQKKKGAA
jgi:hypothetical protein